MASSSSASSGARTAMLQFMLENGIETVSEDASLYTFDNAQHQSLIRAEPWKKDPKYFKNTRISALALLKMVMHARSGVPQEVMGFLQGKVEGDTFIVLDAVPLPVEGTETRVVAMEETYEYMVQYMSLAEKSGRSHPQIGWYHSHPGYRCWLSRTDCGTQKLYQDHQDPSCAIVVDPVTTSATGKVDIGSFRLYPENYKPGTADAESSLSIPLSKMEDFGSQAGRFYAMECSYFKSKEDSALLEVLWNQYWADTLSSSPLLANREHTSDRVEDISQKLSRVENRRTTSFDKSKKVQQLERINKDCESLAEEQLHGLLSEIIKESIFSGGQFS